MELLNQKEFKYLYDFLKPFHHRVAYLVKVKEPQHDSQEEYEAIKIEILGENNLLKLPSFQAGKYYQNLPVDTKYFLNELGITYPDKNITL